MRSPWNWFFLALCVLVPLHVFFVARDPWFTLPPKPIGDGPDYENIAYQLAHGEGWSTDWTDPAWRAPYLAAQANMPTLQASAPDAESSTIDRIVPIDYAVQLARRDGLTPTTARPPLLPALIALVTCVVERGPAAFAIVRILLACCLAIAGATAVAMSARVAALSSTRTWPVAVAAACTLALAAMDRTVRTYATDFLTEPLALLLLQLWLWCACELLCAFGASEQVEPNRDQTKRVHALATLSGILLGLLVYARSAIVLWLPGIWLLLVVGWWIGARSFRSRDSAAENSVAEGVRKNLRHGYAVATRVLVVCLLVCAPWWVRNCVVLGTWMPLGTQGPITLIGGYSDESLAHRGQWRSDPELRLRQRVENELAPEEGGSLVRREVRVAQAASLEVRSWTLLHLSDLPRLLWVRLASEWAPYTGRVLAWKLAALLGLGYLTMRLPEAATLIGGVMLINTLMVMSLYSVGGRFLVPTYGMLYTLAGVGIMSLLLCAYHQAFRRLADDSR